jgi:signal transduction histidine kinase
MKIVRPGVGIPKKKIDTIFDSFSNTITKRKLEDLD